MGAVPAEVCTKAPGLAPSAGLNGASLILSFLIMIKTEFQCEIVPFLRPSVLIVIFKFNMKGSRTYMFVDRSVLHLFQSRFLRRILHVGSQTQDRRNPQSDQDYMYM